MARGSTLGLPLETSRLTLRLPTLSDAPSYRRIQSSRPVVRMRGLGRPPNLRDARTFILRRRREARLGSGYDLAVVLRSNGAVIGRVALKGVHPRIRRAEVAYWFDPKYWGRGLATEAVHALCRAGFRQLRLHRVEAGVFESNPRSIALLKRLGFQQEGRYRKAGWFRRHWVDDLRFGLLRNDLPSALPRTQQSGRSRVPVDGRLPRPTRSASGGAQQHGRTI